MCRTMSEYIGPQVHGKHMVVSISTYHTVDTVDTHTCLEKNRLDPPLSLWIDRP